MKCNKYTHANFFFEKTRIKTKLEHTDRRRRRAKRSEKSHARHSSNVQRRPAHPKEQKARKLTRLMAPTSRSSSTAPFAVLHRFLGFSVTGARNANICCSTSSALKGQRSSFPSHRWSPSISDRRVRGVWMSAEPMTLTFRRASGKRSSRHDNNKNNNKGSVGYTSCGQFDRTFIELGQLCFARRRHSFRPTTQSIVIYSNL